MTRSEGSADAIRARGAAAVVCDVFDREALAAAFDAARPEVLVHELTALPEAIDPRKKGIYDATIRVRTEGTRNLLDAASETGTGRVVAQSIAFVYAPSGGWVKSEDDPVMTGVSGEFGRALAGAMDLERQVLEAPGMEGLVLRYGFFYGPGSGYGNDGHYAREVRKRRFPIVGNGTGTFSFIHIDDAASATVAAVSRGAPGIYNIADDEPAPMSEWIPVYAEALGAKRPLKIPRWLAVLGAGRATAEMATELRGASNARAKAQLGWTPKYSSWRQGFQEALG